MPLHEDFFLGPPGHRSDGRRAPSWGRLWNGRGLSLRADAWIRSVRTDGCNIQPSERPALPFSHVRQSRGEEPPLAAVGNLIDCYQTATNEETHKMVMEYANLLPQYDGMDGKGK